MKKSLAQKEKTLYLPKGIAEITHYYSDPTKAEELFRGFFKSLSADIKNKSNNIDEWDLVLEFTEKIILSQEKLSLMSETKIDLAVLMLQIQELKEAFDNQLNQIRAIRHTVKRQILNKAKSEEPTAEDLEHIKQQNLDIPDNDEELMEFMRQELEKE